MLAFNTLALHGWRGCSQVRIEDERIATEQKFTRKLQIVSREIARREETMTNDEVREVQQ